MSGSKEDNTKFYRETISAVSITYRACDTVSEDGNVSHAAFYNRSAHYVDLLLLFIYLLVS